MKKLLLIALLIVGCDKETPAEAEVKYFMCSWEYEDGQTGCLDTTFQSMSDCEENYCEGNIPFTMVVDVNQETGEINYYDIIYLPLIGCKEYETTTCLKPDEFVPPNPTDPDCN